MELKKARNLSAEQLIADIDLTLEKTLTQKTLQDLCHKTITLIQFITEKLQREDNQ